MIPTTIELEVTTLSPLHHGDLGPDTGNETLFRRMSVNGVPTPVVSGNSVGGILRRIVWRHVFDHHDLNRETVGKGPWDRLYGALANGGHYEKQEVRTDPEEQRQLRETLPPLSAFGAAMYDFGMSGNASFPILVPDTAEGEDPEELIELYSQARHVDRGDQDPKESGVTPMPTTMETLVTGTVLRGTILWTAKPWSEAEVGCIVFGLNRLTRLGGKSRVGLGRVEVEHDGQPELEGAFLGWLDQDSVRENLMRLAERLS